MRNRLRLTPFFIVVLGLMIPGLVSAQVPPGPQPTGQQARGQQAQQQGELNLVFDREVFMYQRMGRRDPFFPLLSQDESGPRFEEIELIGVMLSPNPDLSVAVFGLRGGGGGGGGAMGGQQAGSRPRSYRARRGDQLGNVRILEIQLTRVVVAVDEFGETQQHVMVN